MVEPSRTVMLAPLKLSGPRNMPPLACGRMISSVLGVIDSFLVLLTYAALQLVTRTRRSGLAGCLAALPVPVRWRRGTVLRVGRMLFLFVDGLRFPAR